jgi:hypothetical protein
MDNLPTLMMVALVCAALGFSFGSLLTTIWIDRHPRTVNPKRKLVDRSETSYARILLDSKGEPTKIEIDGDTYSADHMPKKTVLGKLKKTAELLDTWNLKDGQGVRKKEKGIPGKSNGIETEEAANHDMLFEINNIIQERLKGSTKTSKKIRLAREGTTGVVFWVNKANYRTLDAIPDSEVRNLIKGAVAEWESQVG